MATTLHLFRSAREGEGATRDDVGYFSTRRVTLRTEPPQRLLVDGEERGETPALLECVPDSLHVLVADAAEEHVPSERKLDGLPDLTVERKR